MWERELANTKATFEVRTQEIIGRVARNEEDIAQNTSDIEDNTSDIEDNATAIASLQLTADGLTADVQRIENSVTENLLVYPFRETTKTSSGVTITDNGNGTITINGTPTGVVNFDLENTQKLSAGTYTLSGGTAKTYIYIMYNGSYYSESGNGRTFTLSEATEVRIFYYIRSNAGAYDNEVFYPMLVRSSSVHSWSSPVATQTSQIQINAGNISSKVSLTDYNGNTIASLINQTATTIQIAASKINLSGYVTVSNLSTAGSTTINGANITTGNIKVGGSSGNTNGAIYVYDSSDNILVRLNKNGLYLGANQYISCSKLYGGTIKLGGQNDAYGTLELYTSSGKRMLKIDASSMHFYNSSGSLLGVIASGGIASKEVGWSIDNNGISTIYGSYHLESQGDGLYLYTRSGSIFTLRMKLDTTGLYFYDSSGTLTKSYSAV